MSLPPVRRPLPPCTCDACQAVNRRERERWVLTNMLADLFAGRRRVWR